MIMILEKIFYAIQCDVCKKQTNDVYEHAINWLDKDEVTLKVLIGNWCIDNENHYCPDCYFLDKENNLIIKTN